MILPRSLVSRYFLVSLVAAVVPLGAVGYLYDTYAQDTLRALTGQRLSAQLTATASRLGAFFDSRIYQLDTLSNYPSLASAIGRPDREDAEIAALLRIEADVPDLYGIWFFNSAGALSRVIAGQAASGPPYWTGEPPDLSDLPRVRVGGTEILGPVAPRDGAPGWFLMRQVLRDQRSGEEVGSIALHIRLASVSELMGAPEIGSLIQPVLTTPGAGIYDTVGHLSHPRGDLMAGPEIVPGWQAALVIQPDALLGPFNQARHWLYMLVVASVAALVMLFLRLASRLRRRLRHLVVGADAVSAGQLDYRLPETGNDEINVVSRAFNSMSRKLSQLIERTVSIEKMAVLGKFATGVAHEVRNPMATIKTSVQALARQEADPERQEILSGVSAEIDRLTRVMEDLLEYGRPRPPEVGPVPVRDLFRRVSALVSPEAERQGQHLGVMGSVDLVLLADRDHVMQILLNLVVNAMQATAPGGAITLFAHSEGNQGLIKVSDTGGGITDDDLPKVMDPFFTTRTQGTGLGLSICHQLTEVNGGSIHIASQPGTGTTVTLTLPLNGTGDRLG
jgi:two-component system, NtrC family, sensor histidine kinase HydH